MSLTALASASFGLRCVTGRGNSRRRFKTHPNGCPATASTTVARGGAIPSQQGNASFMSTPAPSAEALSESTTAPDARQRAALLLALGLILVWGANFSVQKAVFTALGPGGFLFARYLIMPLCAVALLWQRFGRHWPRLARERRDVERAREKAQFGRARGEGRAEPQRDGRIRRDPAVGEVRRDLR
ncbi:MAG: hypothetical protein N3D71_09355, partial [Burkholderiaceae bacterium]|nr:hypothetical protein [Burkholderiaceae bacterium]